MKLPLLLAAVLLLIVASCKQAPVEYVHRVDTLYIRDTVYTNQLKGTLHGQANLVSYLGPIIDCSGIAVTLEGTSFHALTDSAGWWTIRDLPTGTYNITCSKEAFDTYKVFGYQFVGGGDAYVSNQTLPQIPIGFILSDLKVLKDDGSSYYFDAKLSPPLSKIYQIIMFVGRDSTISSNPESYLFYFSLRTDSSGHIGVPYSRYSYSSFYQKGLKKGDVIFLKAYPSPDVNSGYWDPKNGTTILGLGRPGSNVLSIRLK